MKKWLYFSAKLFVTFLFFFYFAQKYNLNTALNQLYVSERVWLYIAFIMLLLQILLMAVRWHFISNMIKANLSILSAVRFMFIGQFFNQIMPSSIGGDAVRIWMAKQHGSSLAKASSSTILDRIMGLLTYIFVPVLSIWIYTVTLNQNFYAIERAINILAVITIFGILILYFFGAKLGAMIVEISHLKWIAFFIKELKVTLFNSEIWRVLVLSFLIQLIQVLMLLFIAKSFKISIPFNVGMILIPIIFLISTIPLSFAGWGLRESAMIMGLGFFNISAINSLSISLAYGLLQIFSSLPGILLWFQYNGKKN
jgi:uncharacterized protein (TIRG00374 family)